MLLDIASVLEKAKYLGTADNHKGIPRVVQSHIFETEVHEEKALIIVREYDWGGIRAAQHIGQQGAVQPHKKEIAKEAIFRNYNPALDLQRYSDDKDINNPPFTNKKWRIIF